MIKYLLIFIYLTFLGGTVYTDMNFSLRVIHHILVSGLLVVWILGLLRRRESWPRTGLELPLFLFMGVRFASSLLGADPRMSVELFWRPVTHVLLFYWFVWLLRGSDRHRVLRAYFLVMGAVILVGLIEYAGWYLGLPFLPGFQQGWLQIGGLRHPIPPSNWRLNFTLSNATTLSTYLSLLILPAVVMGLRSKRRDMRFGWFILVLSALTVQILTRSRGGLLGLVVSSAVASAVYMTSSWHRIRLLWTRWVRSKAFWLVIAMTLAVLLALAIFLVPSYLSRRSTLDIRVTMWKCALGVVARNSLLGVGTGGFGAALRSCIEPGAERFGHFTTAHNLYLNFAAESGILGLFAFALLVIVLLSRIRERWDQNLEPLDRAEVIVVTSTLVGYAVNCFFDTLTPTPVVLPVLLLVGLLVAPLIDREPTSQWLRPAHAVSLLVVIAFLATLLWFDYGQSFFEQGLKAGTRGDSLAALASVRQAESVDPHLDLYQFQEAFYLGQLAQDTPEEFLASAISAQEAAIQLDDSYSIHLANLAALYGQNAKISRAMTTMEDALDRNPPEPAIWLNYGLLAETAGFHALAVDAYAHALVARPGWASSGFWNAGPRRSMLRESILVRAIELGADPFRLWWATGNVDRAADVVGSPRTGIEYLQRAKVRVVEEEHQAALADLSEAIRLCPRCIEAYVDRSRLYYRLGLLSDAERDARTALFINARGGAPANQTLAWLALRTGNVNAARLHLQRAVPPQAGDYNWEAVLFNRRGDFDLLPQLVRIEGGARTFDPWIELAQMYEEQGQRAEAAEVYRLILVRDPFVPGISERLTALTGR
jgi:tetratricopeptide (TPR) repeat protein/O-antigen ligase